MTNKEAIKELEEIGDNLIDDFTFAKGSYFEALDRAINALEERPTGEWIETGRRNAYGGIEILCSNCQTTLMVSKDRYEFGENYCDVCGAKMKGEEQ